MRKHVGLARGLLRDHREEALQVLGGAEVLALVGVLHLAAGQGFTGGLGEQSNATERRRWLDDRHGPRLCRDPGSNHLVRRTPQKQTEHRTTGRLTLLEILRRYSHAGTKLARLAGATQYEWCPKPIVTFLKLAMWIYTGASQSTPSETRPLMARRSFGRSISRGYPERKLAFILSLTSSQTVSPRLFNEGLSKTANPYTGRDRSNPLELFSTCFPTSGSYN